MRQDPESGVSATTVEDPKDVVVDLPLGFMGSAIAAPTCTFAQLSSANLGGCPADTVVGHIYTDPADQDSVDGPIYNIVPEHGVAAEFGYVDPTFGTHVLYARVVPGPSGYVLQVTAPDIPQIRLTDIITTFYGDPAAKDGTGNNPVAMFTNPTGCDGQPLTTTVHVDSWQHPGSFNADGTPNLSDPNWVSASTTSPPVTGCNQLQFSPSLQCPARHHRRGFPVGLACGHQGAADRGSRHVGDPAVEGRVGDAAARVHRYPSSAAGLGACTPAQIDLASASAPSCPADSQIGTVAAADAADAGDVAG